MVKSLVDAKQAICWSLSSIFVIWDKIESEYYECSPIRPWACLLNLVEAEFIKPKLQLRLLSGIVFSLSVLALVLVSTVFMRNYFCISPAIAHVTDCNKAVYQFPLRPREALSASIRSELSVIGKSMPIACCESVSYPKPGSRRGDLALGKSHPVQFMYIDLRVEMDR